MLIQSLREFLEKFPITLLLLGYLAYLGYDYYTFTTDDASPLQSKHQQMIATQNEIEGLKRKIKQMNEFAQTLDLKKLELRNLAQELEATKATLSETLDMPELMKTLLIEARRAGLTVTSLKPLQSKNGDFYGEQDFEFTSTGIYFQYVAFLERVANLQKIIKVEDISLSPNSSPTAKYVQLRTAIQFKAYRYIGSKADEIARNGRGALPKPAGAGT